VHHTRDKGVFKGEKTVFLSGVKEYTTVLEEVGEEDPAKGV